jgi:hypothetical protein
VGSTYSSVEDMRVMKQFFGILRGQGISVDSYLDLTDGEIKGALTPNTTYLILGENAYEDPNRHEQDPKIATPKVINEKMAEMKKTAMERGLFIISARNFATVVGYTPPVGSESSHVSTFRPQLPSASSLEPGREAPKGGVFRADEVPLRP